jgi:hypothetical protein
VSICSGVSSSIIFLIFLGFSWDFPDISGMNGTSILENGKNSKFIRKGEDERLDMITRLAIETFSG